MRLGKAFFNQTAPGLARALLGKTLVHRDRRAGIVETEAYMAAEDEAAHYVQGKKRAREAYEKGPGTIYIHPMRGYLGIDLVAVDGSVLLRALDMAKADGPGKLTREMGITAALHTLNVTHVDSPVWLEESAMVGRVLVGPRVGISKSAGLPLRYLLVR